MSRLPTVARQPMLSPRARWLLAAIALAAILLVYPVARLAGGETLVTVVSRGGELYAEINTWRSQVPPENLDRALAPRLVLPASIEQLKVAPQSDSNYWQPAQNNPFVALGAAGEWLQSLRPGGEWTHAEVSGDGVGRYTLKNGYVPSWIYVTPPGESRGYALAVRPESRNLSWWRVENGKPVEMLESSSYRPLGRTSVLDLANELLFMGAAAGALCLLVLGANVLLRRLASRRLENMPAFGTGTPLRVVRRWLSRPYVVPIALFLAGTILSAVVCLGVLDGIPHVQDDVAYLFQGRIFALGRSFVPAPPVPAQPFFSNEFIEMFQGRWFAKYPPGYPLLLALGLWAGMPWLINALATGVSLALVYAAGVRMFGRHVAAWAGLLGLISPWVLFMSGSYMSHPTTMMWAALFLYSIVQMQQPRRRGRPWIMGSEAAGYEMQSPPARAGVDLEEPPKGGFVQVARGFSRRASPLGWPALGGFAIGMAFITREWTALGIGVGGALWALGHIALTKEGRLRLLLRYAVFVAGFLPPLLFILFENFRLTGDWTRFAQDLVGSYDRPGFGPGIGSPVGHTPAMGVYNGLSYLRTLGTVFDGWPVPLALAPIALGLFTWIGDRSRRHVAWDALLWLGWLGLVGAYFAWWSATTIFGPRYWYEGMPFLLLIAGRGLDLLGRLAGDALTAVRASRVRWAVPGVLFALFTLYSLSQTLPLQVSRYTDYNGIPVAPLRNAEQAGLKNALVFVQLDPAKPNRDYGKVFFADDPLLRGNVIYARDLGAGRNRTVLQLFPGRQAYWLPLAGPPKPGVGP